MLIFVVGLAAGVQDAPDPPLLGLARLLSRRLTFLRRLMIITIIITIIITWLLLLMILIIRIRK